MKDFFKSRVGKAVATGLSTAIIVAICTPLFEYLFHGEINGNAFEYILEPILTGFFVGLIEYFLPSENKDKEKK